MAFNPFKILKGLIIQKEASLTPDKIEITPNGTANTSTTIQSSQTVNRTITLPDATDTLATVTQVNTVQTNLDNHINDVSDAHDASAISNVPAGSIAATDVQAALNELDTDIQTHITDTSGAHAASSISNVPSGNLVATDVQGALNEIQSELDSVSAVANAAATQELDNLGTTAINASLLPDTDVSYELGSSTLAWNGVFTNAVIPPALSPLNITNNDDAITVDAATDLNLNAVDNVIITADTISLNSLANPINVNSQRITGVASPTSASDAVNKEYADSIAAGLDPKEAVRVATTASLGGSYATTPNNGRFTSAATVVDGVTLTAGDRVLVKNQVDQKQNGIYVYDGAGQYTRAADSDGSPANEVSSGNFTFTTQGTTNSASGFVLLGNGVLTLNTDNLNWTQSSGGASGASRNLDNLLSPTAINQDLLPSTESSRTIGSDSLSFLDVNSSSFSVIDPSVNAEIGSFDNISGIPVIQTPSAASSTKNLLIRTGTVTSGSGVSGAVDLRTGNTVSGASSAINLLTGNSSSNVSGNISLNTGTGTSRGEIILNGRQVNANNTKIVNLADPTAAQDAATKQYVDSNSAIGNLNAMFKQDFDNAVLANFTQTNLDLTTTNPIKGTRTARLPHAPASTNSFKQVIPVDRKFRGQSMTISFVMQSTAVQGDVTLNIFDETNAANIVASEQLSTFSSVLTSVTTTNASANIVVADQTEVNNAKVGERVTGSGIPANSVITAINTSTRTLTLSQNATASATVSLRISDMPSERSVSFLIPDNCASLSYTISALQEPNTPETYVDDILIQLAEFAATSTSVEIPVITDWQSYTPTPTNFTLTSSNLQWRRVGASVEIRGRMVINTVSGAEARLSLPSDLTSASTITTLETAGTYTRNTNGAENGWVLIEPSVSYLTFGVQFVSGNGLTKANSNVIWAGANIVSFEARVPILGWSATEAQNIELTSSVLDQEVDSMVRLEGNSGYGSTNTVIKRFTNTVQNFGDAILYQDSATLGSSFTALKSGVYSFSYSDDMGANNARIGLSLNSNQLTTNIISITAANRLAVAQLFDISGMRNLSVSWTGYLNEGDVVRPHNSGAASSGPSMFTASYQGKLKQVNINPNSKITIPTSELRMEGASSRGAVATAIVRFDSVAKIRGDAFTVTSNANDGTFITMTKSGKLDVSSSLNNTGANTGLYITRNQAVLTAAPIASEILSSDSTATTSGFASSSASTFVNAGDVIRISMVSGPNVSAINNLNLLFQEQDIAVSVTNIQPKFSEADSSIRLNTSNGYGSTATQIRRFSNVTENIGTDISYTDSATQGASFTILKDGNYNIHYGDFFNAQSSLGITLNSSALTTGVGTLVAQPNNSTVLAANSAAANQYQNVSWSGFLPAGSVIRAHAEAAATGDADAARFTIAKVGKPNITAVDVTPFIDIPQVSMEAVSGRCTVVGAAVSSFDAITSNTASKLITSPTIVSGRIRFTILKRSLVNVASGVRATNNAATAEIFVDGVSRGQLQGVVSFQDPTVGGGALTEVINAGSVVEIGLSNQDSTSGNPFSYSAIGLSDQILTEVETFNSDTAPFVYAGSATYTLSTLQNAPVGTFITFTYGAGSNGVTQTNAAPPTQTTADMNVNGIRIYSIPYNSASTAALPASIAIQIGKGLKGLNLGIYKSVNKAIPGTIDFYTQSGNKRGLSFKNYNETTGILYLDARFDGLGGSTASTFEFVDNSVQSDGYVVINASKNPALAGLNSVEPLVAASYWLSATGSVTANTPVNYDSREYDPYLAVSTGANWRFTCPVGKAGYYLLNGAINAVTASFGFVLFKNNSQYKQIGWDGVAIDACFSATVYLSDNEFIDVRPNVTNTFNGSATLASSTNNITITRLGSRG